MKISISSYSFFQYINMGKMTQLDCVGKAKEIGFDAIEFIEIDGDTFEEKKENARKIKEEANKLGMSINAYTIGANLFKDSVAKDKEEIERLKGHLHIAEILGAKVMRHDVCGSLGKKGAARSFDLMLPTIAKNARTVTEYAETLGIRTCCENHGVVAQDSDRIERLFNAVNHDNFGILVDMGNFLCVDENPATAFSRLASYAIHAHVKDMLITDRVEGALITRGGNYILPIVIGEGSVPVEKCIRILKNAGYDGYLSIEYEGAGDCIEGIKKSYDNLKKFMHNAEL